MSKIKLGIVDDQVLFLKGLTMLIANFKDIELVLTASNGKELLNALAYGQPDVLLMDLKMPEMDGLTAIRRIRQTSWGKQVVIIAYTASSYRTSEFMIPAGCNDILDKPFKLHELKGLMQKYLHLNIVP